uniref:Uncharacterized protein n=1 Tax=Siphoviridae sp. ctKNZ79 TaxID=2825440 RepID=A0A8S5U9V7_9CAUD|nr:MAG TPA: hypothetical protein [Siphoviridae sp. ctKNZ79]
MAQLTQTRAGVNRRGAGGPVLPPCGRRRHPKYNAGRSDRLRLRRSEWLRR